MLFFSVLPNEAGCYLDYWATPWGRASILFASAASLFVRHPVGAAASLNFSALCLYRTGEHFFYNGEEFSLTVAYWFNESGVVGVLRFIYRELFVAGYALLLFCYGVVCFARSFVRRSAPTP